MLNVFDALVADKRENDQICNKYNHYIAMKNKQPFSVFDIVKTVKNSSQRRKKPCIIMIRKARREALL
ncbi:MAG: hypothetical protein J6D53_08045, partial [Blautia sp.]|nr:hypothetical protein [Blautia sp.]